MTDHDALSAAILREPHEDTPRLALADWLEEHGDVERAHFIRTQCAGGLAVVRLTWLVADEMLLGCQPHECSFAAGKGEAVITTKDGKQIVFRKGFWDEVRLSAAAFLVGPECAWCRAAQGDLPTEFRGVNHCPFCKGTGRTPGLAASLFSRHPITAVRLADKHPLNGTPGTWSWRCNENAPVEDDAHHLPHDLFDRIAEGGDADGWYWKTFPNEAAAHAALSSAAVALGRERAGLPPLPAEQLVHPE